MKIYYPVIFFLKVKTKYNWNRQIITTIMKQIVGMYVYHPFHFHSIYTFHCLCYCSVVHRQTLNYAFETTNHIRARIQYLHALVCIFITFATQCLDTEQIQNKQDTDFYLHRFCLSFIPETHHPMSCCANQNGIVPIRFQTVQRRVMWFFPLNNTDDKNFRHISKSDCLVSKAIYYLVKIQETLETQ